MVSYFWSIETNLRIGKHTLRVFTWYLEQIVGKSLFRCFIYVLISICCYLFLFWRVMLLNATLWFTVTHTFQGNETEFADRSKWICITLQSCFCRLLAWNWEVSTGRFFNSFFVFSQVAQHLVISSYIKILNKIFLFGKTALRVFTWYFEEIVGKNLFACFIYVFDSIRCSLCHS